MPSRLLVTVGTDGVTDWVRLPDGQRLNLGSLSVASFVSKLTGGRSAKAALDDFLAEGEALVNVDEEVMWELLTPRQARWATSDGSLMPLVSRPVRNDNMSLVAHVQDLETHIAALNKAAAAKVPAEKMREGIQILMQIGQRVCVAKEFSSEKALKEYLQAHPGADKSKHTVHPMGDKDDDDEDTKRVKKQLRDSDAVSKGQAKSEKDKAKAKDKKDKAKEDEGTEKLKKDLEKYKSDHMAAEGSMRLAFDVFQANQETAQGILSTAEATVAKIDELVTAGKKFNAAKAKVDIYAVTSKVAGILAGTDLTASWIQDDLQKLAARADHLHGLFVPKR